MIWNYWKCKVTRNKKRRDKTYTNKPKWTVYVIESGYCLSHHRTWKKAISTAIQFQANKWRRKHTC